MILDRRNPDIDLVKVSRKMIQQTSNLNPETSDENSFGNVRWEKKVLQFMESIPELVIVMSAVCISTFFTVLQMISPSSLSNLEFQSINIVILLFFCFELSLRGYVHFQIRRKWMTFWKDHFVQLDLSLILLDILVMSTESSLGNYTAALRILRMLRLVRIARAMRLLKKLPPTEQPEIRKWILPIRYRTCGKDELAIMTAMITVLSDLQAYLHDYNSSLFFKNFILYWKKNPEILSPMSSNSRRDDGLEASFMTTIREIDEEEIISTSTDDILLDLVMYVNKDLVQNTLDLLMGHHTRYRTLFQNVSQMKLFVTPRRVDQYRLIQEYLLELRSYLDISHQWTGTDIRKSTDQRPKSGSAAMSAEGGGRTNEMKICHRIKEILITLQNYLKIRRKIFEYSSDFEADCKVQFMLRNSLCWNILRNYLKLFHALFTNPSSSSSAYLREIFLHCQELLYWYVYRNTENQREVFDELHFFLDLLDGNFGCHINLFHALFSSNEILMKKVSNSLIVDCLDRICSQGKAPQYLFLLSSITVIAETSKNIPQNQYRIIKEMTSPSRQHQLLLYFVPTSHFEYQKKIKLMSPYLTRKGVQLHDLPSALIYHIELLKVLSGCTTGYYNITTIETKVQIMFPYSEIIDAILDERTILIVRIATSLFFYNTIIEVEMMIPGLTLSSKVWDLLKHCLEIIKEGFNLMKELERNEWELSTQLRYELEYLLICCRIVSGYFKRYYDPMILLHRERDSSSLELDHKKEDQKKKGGPNRSSTFHHHRHHDGLSNQTAQDMKLVIKELFDSLLLIYEFDCLVLANKEKYLFYQCLDYLSRAQGISYADFIQIVQPQNIETMSLVTHASNPQLVEKHVSTDASDSDDQLEEKLDMYLQQLKESKNIQALLSGETDFIISKINSLPLASDAHSTSTVRYEALLKKLVDHIRTSIEDCPERKEKYLSPRYTRTAIWIIQIFRQMIENVWGMTIYERDDEGGEEQDRASSPLIHTFNLCGITTLCLDLIAVGIHRELVIESLKLVVAMLFKEGGALTIQRTIYDHLNATHGNTKSEYFFLQLRQIVTELIAWHDWNAASKKMMAQSGEVNQVASSDQSEEQLPEDIIAIRMLQLMCEGHYGSNQDILREQPNNKTTVNILDDLVSYLIAIHQLTDSLTASEACVTVSSTILELIQGPCEGNQNHFTFQTTLIEILNSLMRKSTSSNTNSQILLHEYETKKTGIKILQGLLEGQGKKHGIYDRILSVLHLDVIQILVCNPKNNEEEEQGLMKKQAEVTLLKSKSMSVDVSMGVSQSFRSTGHCGSSI
jgi:hypothetical protein